MSDKLDEMYGQTHRLTLQMHNRLERLINGYETVTPAMEEDTRQKLDQIQKSVDRLQLLVQKEPAQSRQKHQMRVTQLAHDVNLLVSAYTNHQNQQIQRRREQEDREKLLLNTTFKPNSETSILMDQAMQEHSKLVQANRGLDDLLENGASILSNLTTQKGALKAVQRRVLDIANTLGMSNTVMRMIESRKTQDRLILFGGMLVTLFVMYLTVRYLR
eukprot:comp9777_c0_seq1/m.4735 comp9777_c0_seq1/g.4735  ORF comp9777_c0_seq1/g.4735 comp9777_c0_seq1/m.4735 type:complete len:217 (-) comp9777_c0_seq1:559-1209(-)